MRKILFCLIALSYGVSASAKSVKAMCHRISEDGDSIIQTKSMAIEVSETLLHFNIREVGEVNSRFLSNSSTGNYMYDGTALTDLADQVDLGYIFVEPILFEEGNGLVEFSIRQLGDSEGHSWLSAKFTCREEGK